MRAFYLPSIRVRVVFYVTYAQGTTTLRTSVAHLTPTVCAVVEPFSPTSLVHNGGVIVHPPVVPHAMTDRLTKRPVLLSPTHISL